jgi:hypothetical protein
MHTHTHTHMYAHTHTDVHRQILLTLMPMPSPRHSGDMLNYYPYPLRGQSLEQIKGIIITRCHVQPGHMRAVRMGSQSPTHHRSE